MLTDDRDAYDMGGEVGIAVMPIEPTMVDDNEMEEDIQILY